MALTDVVRWLTDFLRRRAVRLHHHWPAREFDRSTAPPMANRQQCTPDSLNLRRSRVAVCLWYTTDRTHSQGGNSNAGVFVRRPSCIDAADAETGNHHSDGDRRLGRPTHRPATAGPLQPAKRSTGAVPRVADRRQLCGCIYAQRYRIAERSDCFGCGEALGNTGAVCQS